MFNYDAIALKLEREGRKQTTIKKVVSNLRILDKHLNSLEISAVDAAFLKMKREGKSATYLNILIQSLRCYAKYFDIPELRYYPEFAESKPYVATMTDEEIEAFLTLPALPNTNLDYHRLWTLFFAIAAYTGMRPGEVAKLRVGDVNLADNTFNLVDTKTNDNRIVPIPPLIEDDVFWLLNRVDDLLFVTNQGGMFRNTQWNYQFHTRLKRMGVKRRGLKPYSLRHSYITTMLQEEGVNIFDIKRIVGHKRTSTTEQYYHYGTKRLKKVISKHPNVLKAIDDGEVLRRFHKMSSDFFSQFGRRFAVSMSLSENIFRLEAVGNGYDPPPKITAPASSTRQDQK